MLTSIGLIFPFCVVVSLNSLTIILEHWKTHHVVTHPLIRNILTTISIFTPSSSIPKPFTTIPFPLTSYALVRTKLFGSNLRFIQVNVFTHFIIKRVLTIDILVEYLWAMLLDSNMEYMHGRM